MTVRLAALAAAAALVPPALACTPAVLGDDGRTIEGIHFVVAWRAPARLPLAEFFTLDFAACARDGAAVERPRVDATMPEHGHGMNYRPTVETLGGGRFRARGLLLHMPGRWQLSFALADGTVAETLYAVLNVD